MKRTPIKMPVLSDTMKTGHLSRWLKQVGDPVKKGDILAEIESDKAAMDLEAFEDGYLAGPLANADSDIAVGLVIGYLVDSLEDYLEEKQESNTQEAQAADPQTVDAQTTETSPEASPEQTLTNDASLQSTQTPNRTPDHNAGSHKASPYARGLARELGIDLSTVRPDGDGIISSRQVLAAALTGPLPNLKSGPAFTLRPFTPMQRALAKNMSATIHTPTFRVNSEIPIEPLQQTAATKKVSFTLLISRVAALTVVEHPHLNMAYTPAGLATRKQVDVGIAMDVPGGLVTPVICDAAGRPLNELQEDWRILHDKAKRQRLVPQDYKGATFYVSNMGMFSAVQSFDAIVPLGAAGILSIGASANGKAVMTLSCDHRVVSGADAARFMERFKERMAHANLK